MAICAPDFISHSGPFPVLSLKSISCIQRSCLDHQQRPARGLLRLSAGSYVSSVSRHLSGPVCGILNGKEFEAQCFERSEPSLERLPKPAFEVQQQLTFYAFPDTYSLLGGLIVLFCTQPESTPWSFKMQTLHQRSGSKGSLREFRRQLKPVIATDHLPDYRITYDAADDIVTFQNRNTMPRDTEIGIDHARSITQRLSSSLFR